MSNKPYADLHLHVHMRSYNNVATDKYRDTRHYHPWTVSAGNLKKQRTGKRAFTYNQSNLVLCTNSNTSLVFNSLYPIEQGFFIAGDTLDNRKIDILMDYLVKHDLLNLITSGLGRLLKDKLNDPNLRLRLQAEMMKIPLERARFFASEDYDYWQELHTERDFILHNSGVERQSEVLGGSWVTRQWQKLVKKEDYKRNTEARGKYTICNNAAEVDRVLSSNSGIAMVMTIEGAHVLGAKKLNLNLPEHRSIMLGRIEQLRCWQHCRIFFITVGHHFDNGISGHAKSLPAPSDILLNQLKRVDEGLTAFGEECLAHFLGFMKDANGAYVKNSALAGKDILLDLKHSSARTRKDIYDRMYRQITGTLPPLVYSHMGYSGTDSTDELIALNNPAGDATYLNRWNINMCNEDLYWAVKTKGLIGLSLDQRICGIDTETEEKDHDKTPGPISADALWQSLKGMLDGIINHSGLSDAEKQYVWDIFCLGSDFDGYIDPLNQYATVFDLPELEAELTAKFEYFVFNAGLTADYQVPQGATAASLARKICFENARDFVMRHF